MGTAHSLFYLSVSLPNTSEMPFILKNIKQSLISLLESSRIEKTSGTVLYPLVRYPLVKWSWRLKLLKRLLPKYTHWTHLFKRSAIHLKEKHESWNIQTGWMDRFLKVCTQKEVRIHFKTLFARPCCGCIYASRWKSNYRRHYHRGHLPVYHVTSWSK